MHTAYRYIKTRVRLKSMDIYDSLLEAVRNEYDTVTVSYTHLTLPTICSV